MLILINILVYRIGFDSRSLVVIFEVDNSSSVHIRNKKNNILGLMKGIDDTTIAVEAKCSMNFSRSQRKFRLSLHYNGSDSFLFVSAITIYQFNAKNPEIKSFTLCLRDIPKDFTANNKKTKGLNGFIYCVSVDYNVIDINCRLYLLPIFINTSWKNMIENNVCLY